MAFPRLDNEDGFCPDAKIVQNIDVNPFDGGLCLAVSRARGL